MLKLAAQHAERYMTRVARELKPGMNAAVRAVVRAGLAHGHEVVAIRLPDDEERSIEELGALVFGETFAVELDDELVRKLKSLGYIR